MVTYTIYHNKNLEWLYIGYFFYYLYAVLYIYVMCYERAICSCGELIQLIIICL